MDKHKTKALEDKCLCNQCPYKFECFTQERVFSDPIYQGLFEAFIAQGHTRAEAIDMVANELKARIAPQPSWTVSSGGSSSSDTFVYPSWTQNSYTSYTSRSYPVTQTGDKTTYHMYDGNDVYLKGLNYVW